MPTPLHESEPPNSSGPQSEFGTGQSMIQNRSPKLAIEHQPSTIAKEDEVEEVHTLDLGQGNVVNLDKLGPMIVNTDGTLSRIQNWHELGEIERERTVRLLVKKRNLVRLNKMDEQVKNAGRADGEQLSALKEGSKAET